MKKYFSFLLLLGMLVAVSPIFSGCSDDNTETPQPEPEPTPDVPDNPTPIQWDEMEAKAGERGVGIKVTNLSENDFSFELTPGANVQSYRMDVYPVSRMYNYLLEEGGKGADADKIEELVLAAIYNSQGAGGYTFQPSVKTFDSWATSKYAQSEIVPDAEYIIITVGCNDNNGQSPADVHICHLTTPKKEIVGDPRMDIDVTPGFTMARITYKPNADCKYFYQYCVASKYIDTYIEAYGEKMYIDFLRHTSKNALDAQTTEEDLTYYPNFGETADPNTPICVTAIALDENKTAGKFMRKDFNLNAIPDEAKQASCTITIGRVGSNTVELKSVMDKYCRAAFYRIFSKSEWEGGNYENSEENTKALIKQLSDSGWGLKNPNYSTNEDESKEGEKIDIPFDVKPNTEYVLAYIASNRYGQSSGLKTATFKTLTQQYNLEAALGGDQTTVECTSTDRTKVALKIAFDSDMAVIYFQYINTVKDDKGNIVYDFDRMLKLGEDGKTYEIKDETEIIKFLLDDRLNNEWGASKDGTAAHTYTGMTPGTTYVIAYMTVDWNGNLSQIKLLQATTEAIQGGSNPTMILSGKTDQYNRFEVEFKIDKDVSKFRYMITKDTYSTNSRYSYKDCMEGYRSDVMGEAGLETINSTSLNSSETVDKVGRFVALCVPIGKDEQGQDKVGDLYTLWYDQSLGGVISDPAKIFKDYVAPTAKYSTISEMSKRVQKMDRRTPAYLLTPETRDMRRASTVSNMDVKTIVIDMKQLGTHPHAK